MPQNVFFTEFPKNDNGYQGNQCSQQWARWYMLFFETRAMVSHGVDKIVAVAIVKETCKTFCCQNCPKWEKNSK